MLFRLKKVVGHTHEDCSRNYLDYDEIIVLAITAVNRKVGDTIISRSYVCICDGDFSILNDGDIEPLASYGFYKYVE